MLNKIHRILGRWFNKSTKTNNEPLNKVSLIVIILIDIFILFNVFSGLDDISLWYLSPYQAYPCYEQWNYYHNQIAKEKDYEIVSNSLLDDNFQQTYQQVQAGHLGRVAQICLNYKNYQDKIKNVENQQSIKTIAQKDRVIQNLESRNREIHTQYDSTLLEKIAGQKQEQSINSVSAAKAKQALEQNKQEIYTLEEEVSHLKSQLVAKPESQKFLAFLKDESQFSELEKGYHQASFWYPSIQIAFELLFLLPLIFIALLVHKFSQSRGYGLLSLISWHLLVIFLIPLVLRVFEFFQIGAVFEYILNFISNLLGGLLFLVSYVYILIIPLVGFGIIQFFQKIVFNKKGQVVSRVQKTRCINCAKKIRPQDIYCPHCGDGQFFECHNCHHLTYKFLPYCRECGHLQDVNNLMSKHSNNRPNSSNQA
jgi:predicted RNA-binding Zn-ribbon protein involved in translation (DUF1610 family)